jgi:hypothetical protein
MKVRIFLKKLSNPRVRRRLKIGLSLWAVAILIGLVFKFAYDIGYFKAQSVINENNAAKASARSVLTVDAAQRIVTGALKEDPKNPKTIVSQIIGNNQNVATIFIENNNQKSVAWIVDMRLFFVGDLFNDNGYNLTEAIENQYNITSRDH